MNILWVTSFNEKIYEASGKSLLLSHQNTQSEGAWFIGLEKIIISTPRSGGMCIPIQTSEWLKRWLERNKDISPPTVCSCPDPWARKEKNHIKNCPHTWFNRNAYRWIRKIATLYHALEYSRNKDYNYMVWIDADCTFIKKVFAGTIHALHRHEQKEYDALYLKGSQRNVMEAGFVSYDLFSPVTHNFLLSLFNYYMSGSFRELCRWDDSYVIGKLIDGCELEGRDIATTTSDQFSGVFKNSLIGEYIEHHKGKHGRELGIMK